MSERRFPPPWSVEELDACFGTALATSLLVSLGQCARSWRSLSPHDTRSCSDAPVALLDADLGAELTDQRAHLFRRAALPFTVGGDSTSKQCYCLTKPPGRNS